MKVSLYLHEMPLSDILATIEAALGYIKESIVVLSAQGKVQWCNTVFSSFLEQPRDDLLGKRFDHLMPFQSNNKILPMDWLSCDPVESYFEHLELTYLDELYYLSVYGQVFKTYTGENATVLVISDESGRRELMTKVIEQQKIESIRAIADNITREIQVPLYHLEQQLSESNPLDRKQILDDVLHIKKLLQSVMTYSTKKHVERQPVNVIDIVNEVKNETKPHWQYRAKFEVALDAKYARVYSIADDLKTVFMNLIVNASDAITERHGELNKEGLIQITSCKQDELLIISITDNGAGIEATNKEKVFDPFFTTKALGKGTGHGLSIVQKTVVNKLKGKVELESEPQKGTCIKVYLPLYL